MATLRLTNGHDITVTLTLAETVAALRIVEGGPEFVELPGEQAPVLIRPDAVIAVIEDAKRGQAGFRVSSGA